MNFYVGQEVVAIADHSQGDFKKGDEFVIQGIKKTCDCCLDLNIGIKHPFESDGTICCSKCGIESKSDGYMWYDSTMFAPKQHLSETTYNEVMMWIEQGNEIAILN